MKLIEKLSKKFTKAASETVKDEVKKTAIDLLPGILSVIGMGISMLIFKGTVTNEEERPTVTTTTITTNNYFFGEVSEDTMMDIIDESRRG